MGKSKPAYAIAYIKTRIAAGKIAITVTARRATMEKGVFTPKAVCAELMLLAQDEFYKSMTPHADHTLWQDVYRHRSAVGMLYVKLTVQDNVLILSFKEL